MTASGAKIGPVISGAFKQILSPTNLAVFAVIGAAAALANWARDAFGAENAADEFTGSLGKMNDALTQQKSILQGLTDDYEGYTIAQRKALVEFERETAVRAQRGREETIGSLGASVEAGALGRFFAPATAQVDARDALSEQIRGLATVDFSAASTLEELMRISNEADRIFGEDVPEAFTTGMAELEKLVVKGMQDAGKEAAKAMADAIKGDTELPEIDVSKPFSTLRNEIEQLQWAADNLTLGDMPRDLAAQVLQRSGGPIEEVVASQRTGADVLASMPIREVEASGERLPQGVDFYMDVLNMTFDEAIEAMSRAPQQSDKWDQFGQSFQNTLSTVLTTNVVNGDWDKLGKTFTILVLNELTKPLISQAASGIAGFLGGLGGTAHSGGTVPGNSFDNVPMILKGGEHVTPAGQARVEGKMGQSVTVNYNPTMVGDVSRSTMAAVDDNFDAIALRVHGRLNEMGIRS